MACVESARRNYDIAALVRLSCAFRAWVESSLDDTRGILPFEALKTRQRGGGSCEEGLNIVIEYVSIVWTGPR